MSPAYRLKLNCTFTLPNEVYKIESLGYEYVFNRKGLIIIKERVNKI